MSTSIRDALTKGAARLQAEGIESARLDARVLLAHAIGVSSDALFSTHARQHEITRFDSLIERRAMREPLAYITGRKEFWSLQFEVGPGVLVPRSETETLIEEALRRFPDIGMPLRVLDIGTGSGCLIVALLKERPNASGLGIDCLERALAYARRNAVRHELNNRCLFELVEFGPSFRDYVDKFDVILANPPYLTDEEFMISACEIKDFEPSEAFVAGPDGLAAFRAFLPVVAKSLSPAGVAFFEIGIGQSEKVTKIVMDTGLEVQRAVSDLSGIPRCLAIGRAG